MGTDMRRLTRGLLGALACLLPMTGAAEERPPRSFGAALNTSVNGEVYPMRLVPSAIMLFGRSQLEAGVGLHPFIRRDQRVLSGETSYKFFPNGTERALNLYLIGRLSYVNNARETFYPTTYHYLFLNGGYGVMVSNPNGLYIGTNVTAGPFTYMRQSENPYEGFDSDRLFDEVGLNLAFQFNIGYRF